MKKWIKITSIVTAVIAVIVLAVAVSIAPLAKNYIEKHDRELLGRSIRMERLKFNIFTGRLRIGDLRIGGADDSTTFFRLDSFDMRMRLWPLLSNRVVVKKLSFAAPGIRSTSGATRSVSTTSWHISRETRSWRPQRPKSRRSRGK